MADVVVVSALAECELSSLCCLMVVIVRHCVSLPASRLHHALLTELSLARGYWLQL